MARLLSFERWMRIATQDLALSIVGAVLFSLSFFLGEVGLLTLFLGCGFMGFATFDFMRLLDGEREYPDASALG